MTSRRVVKATGSSGEAMELHCHDFGPSDQRPRAALVSGTRSDDLNGVFVLSRLAALLQQVAREEHPSLRLHRRVVVLPSVLVPGLGEGGAAAVATRGLRRLSLPPAPGDELAARLAQVVLDLTGEAYYRVHVESPGADSEELPQVRLHRPNDDERASAFLFGLPAVVEELADPVNGSCLVPAWEGRAGESFVLQAGRAGDLQLAHCERVFRGLVSFLRHSGILSGSDIDDSDQDVHLFGPRQSFSVLTEAAGLFISPLAVGQWLLAGDTIGFVYDGFDGSLRAEVKSPVAGLLSALRRQPLVGAGEMIARLQVR